MRIWQHAKKKSSAESTTQLERARDTIKYLHSALYSLLPNRRPRSLINFRGNPYDVNLLWSKFLMQCCVIIGSLIASGILLGTKEYIKYIQYFLSMSMLRMSCHPLCTWMASLPCGSFHVPSSGQLLRRPCHTLSKKGFSPVWVWSRVEYVEKLLSQLVHLNDFSAIWVLSCSFKWPVIEKILSYFKQKRLLSHVGLVPWWVCWEALVVICALEWLLSRVGHYVTLSGQLLRRCCHTLSI